MSEEEIDLSALEEQDLSGLFSDGEQISHQVEIEVIDPEAQELIVDLPEFEDKRFSLVQKFNHKRRAIAEQLAGVDPIPPKNGVVMEFDPDDPFLQLLRPLPANEILSLSAEISADDTVFVRIERQRRQQFRNHSLASFLAAATMVIFALLVGPQFITETLINLSGPEWLPGEIPGDVVSGALFVIGTIIPIAVGFALLRGYRLLLSGVMNMNGWELLSALPALGLSAAALLLVANGAVIVAALLVVAQLAISALLRLGEKWLGG